LRVTRGCQVARRGESCSENGYFEGFVVILNERPKLKPGFWLLLSFMRSQFALNFEFCNWLY
jgi:hypothetical protein